MPHHADLCAYTLPSGRTCRQVALKGEQGCRHHMRLFRHAAYDTLHLEAMEQLEARLNSLDLSALLRDLLARLNRLRSTVRAMPEAQLALRLSIERLKQQKKEDQQIQRMAKGPMPAFGSPEFLKMFEEAFSDSMS